MLKRDSKLLRFWNEDRSLSVMLLLLLSFVFVFVPLLSRGRGGGILLRVIYSAVLFTGILSVAKNKRYLIAVSTLAAIALVVNWLVQVFPGTPIKLAHDFSAILFIVFFALIMLLKTFQQGEINYQRIAGSIVVYLLIGLIFGYVFHAIYLFAGASSFNNTKGSELKEFLYFSFTSLTTMGYGDITPVHPLARSMANFEALIGQLYPAILIARLVSMEFEASTRKKQKDG